MTVSGQCVDVVQPHMKKIAFTLNTICMVLFLPVLDCVVWLCTVHVYRGMKTVLCFPKVFKRRIKEDKLRFGK